MTFHENARVENPRVRRRGRARAGLALGGGSLLVLFLLSQLLGVDLTDLVGDDDALEPEPQDTSLEHCLTGAQANEYIECRMVFAYESLDDYWVEAYPGTSQPYTSPGMDLFTGSVNTGCGNATSAVGPFYCPPDRGIYLDTEFFETLQDQLGAEGGPLAEMYVVAHEWGHHIQNISGIMDAVDTSGTGADSDAVRLELQADCLAGAWAAGATSTTDAEGNAFLEPFTEAELATALDAAATVGDDHIAEQLGGQSHPETWTHGSSEQRQNWFLTGYESGPAGCDTFAVAGEEL